MNFFFLTNFKVSHINLFFLLYKLHKKIIDLIKSKSNFNAPRVEVVEYDEVTL